MSGLPARGPGKRDVAIAASAAVLVNVGAAVVAVFARSTAARLMDASDRQRALIVEQLGALGAAMAWDAVFGAWALAAAVVLTAAWSRVPTRPLHRVFLRLWFPYAVLGVLLQLGLILVLPGMVLAVGALAFLDPVAMGEQRGFGVAVPGGRRALLLGALFVGWVCLSAVWNVGIYYFIATRGGWIEYLAHAAYQLLTFGCWLAWCAILRRTNALGEAEPT